MDTLIVQIMNQAQKLGRTGKAQERLFILGTYTEIREKGKRHRYINNIIVLVIIIL